MFALSFHSFWTVSGCSGCVVLVLACVLLLWLMSKIFAFFGVFVSSGCLAAVFLDFFEVVTVLECVFGS